MDNELNIFSFFKDIEDFCNRRNIELDTEFLYDVVITDNDMLLLLCEATINTYRNSDNSKERGENDDKD